MKLPSPIRAAALMLAGATIACGGDQTGPGGSTNPPAGTPGVHILTGASVTDTIDAVQTQALIVQINDAAGKPKSGVTARFTVTTAPSNQFPGAAFSTMTVSRLSSTSWSSIAVDTTDAAGKVAILTKMGTIAGPGSIVVNVPTLGTVDTARYTIRPGNALRLTVSPRDTMVYVGARVQPRIVVSDRYSNVVSGSPALTSSSNHVSIAGDGTMTGASIGRDLIRVTSGTLRDSMFVSVPPTGTVAVYTWDAAQRMAIYTFNLDGSNLRKLVSTTIFAGYFGEMPPVWSTDGRTIFYHDDKTDHTRMLWKVDVTSGASQRLIVPTEQMPDERYPARSADGRWLYFNNGSPYDPSMAYRVHTDGTGVERVSPSGYTQLYPQPSPDGTSIVYTSGAKLELMNVATKAITKLNVSANVARWSPSGSLIAYATDAGVYIIRPDGTSAKQLFTGASTPVIEWSPDEKYVALAAAQTLMLINVATGEQLPITVTIAGWGLGSPAWKP